MMDGAEKMTMGMTAQQMRDPSPMVREMSRWMILKDVNVYFASDHNSPCHHDYMILYIEYKIQDNAHEHEEQGKNSETG